MLRTPSSSSLFPYTTLFRSVPLRWQGWSVRRSRAFLARSHSSARWPRRSSASTRLIHHDGGPGNARERRRSEEHTSELQSPYDLVCRLLLEKKKTTIIKSQR